MAYRILFVGLGLLFAYSGAMLLWQLAAQPNVNGCYVYPFGFGGLVAPYQNGCPYNSLPNYYAADTGMLSIVIGFFFVLYGRHGRR